MIQYVQVPKACFDKYTVACREQGVNVLHAFSLAVQLANPKQVARLVKETGYVPPQDRKEEC
jgi:hypothetical protein